MIYRCSSLRIISGQRIWIKSEIALQWLHCRQITWYVISMLVELAGYKRQALLEQARSTHCDGSYTYLYVTVFFSWVGGIYTVGVEGGWCCMSHSQQPLVLHLSLMMEAAVSLAQVWFCFRARTLKSEPLCCPSKPEERGRYCVFKLNGNKDI